MSHVLFGATSRFVECMPARRSESSIVKKAHPSAADVSLGGQVTFCRSAAGLTKVCKVFAVRRCNCFCLIGHSVWFHTPQDKQVALMPTRPALHFAKSLLAVCDRK